jgi:hypothetical protein
MCKNNFLKIYFLKGREVKGHKGNPWGQKGVVPF